MTRQALAVLALACGVARADEPPDATDSLSADDVAGAPRPGQEHGRRDPIDPGDSTGRKIARAALWVPRLPFELVAWPLRTTLAFAERHELIGGASDPSAQKVEFLPAILVDSDFGVELGMRAQLRNVFADEKVSGRAALGLGFQRIATLDLDSGKPTRTVSAGLEARYEVRDAERFYGYGNRDLAREPLVMPLDPLAGDTAITTRYHLQLARIAPRVRITPLPTLRFTLSGAFIDRTFGPGTETHDPSIDDGFMVDRLPGYDSGTREIYTEAEAAWDTRGVNHPFDPPAMRASGALALVYAGREHSLSGQADSFRAGAEVQRYFPLTTGPRAILLRLAGELVTAPRDEIAFTDLPQLGGFDMLRGYPNGRFRDRVAAVGQATYLWGMGDFAAARVFVDAGRVYTGLDALTLDELRVGFGSALDIYTRSRWLVSFQGAMSIDRDLVGSIGFGRRLEGLGRVERR